ncbi:MAG: hypothetical protein ACREBD_26115 [Blastocatellia bacterium]
MKRQTKHIVFGLLFTVMVGVGLMIQAQTPCPAQATCAPVVQTQPVCAPVVQAPQPVNCPAPAQPTCAPVVAAPACCGGEEFDDLLESIEENADSFRSHIPKSLDECVINSCARGTFLNQNVADFEVATDRLEHNFKHDSMTTADAQEVLDRAAYIDSFMSSNNVSGKAASDWSELRADLDKLASCQSVATRWGDPAYAWNKQSNRLTGTYRLDPSRSDKANVALTSYTAGPCGCQQQVSHLDTPEMLAIDQNGQCVTIASSTGRQVATVADGQLVPDATRGVSTQTTLQEGDALFIRTYSERDSARNYTATFTPTDDGVLVTRYVNTGDPTKPSVIKSYYTRTSDVAQLNLYDGATSPQRQVVYSGNFVVPNGANLVATLNEGLDASQAREGDRFTMNVSSPSEYDGAVIEGFISDVGGAGRAAFNFERIRLSDGRVFDFAAEIVSASTTDGAGVKVSSGAWINEQERQAQQNLVRTSQSAAIGSVVGTIPVSGSGTGVNSIYTPAGGDLKLGSGTEFVLRAASPRTI